MIKLDILIVGAGVSGLSTAIALQQSGHKTTVLERHPSCQALGGSVSLSPNATRLLIQYGMKDIMLEKNTRNQNPTYQRRYADGTILGVRQPSQSEKEYGFPSWTLARFRLQEALLQVAQERGVKVMFEKVVESVDLKGPSVMLKDGEVFEADIVVGADGIRSVTRDAVGSGVPVKIVSPFSAYNIDVPRSFLKEDPKLAHLLEEANFWLGPSRLVVGLNMPDMGDKYNILLVSEEPTGKEGEWYELGDLKKVKEKFNDWDPAVQKLLQLTKPEDCYIWRLSEMPPLEKWASDNGKVVMVGDAVHAMLPYAGMGASQCIEDSACLAICLSKAESASDLPEVLKAFETIRKPRTEWLVRRGREIAKTFHLPDGLEQEQRDAFLGIEQLFSAGTWDGKHIDDPPEGVFNRLTFVYMSGFDVVDYTKRRLEEILG